VTSQVPAGYGSAGSRIEIRSDDLDAARWLEEFLVPWLDPIDAGPWDHCARFTMSDSAYATLEREAARHVLEPVAGFALDQEAHVLPGWRAAEAWHLFDAERECYYRLRKGEADIVTRPGNRSARLALMRTVREFATTRARLARGCLDLHAAAFEVGGRAVLVVGPKGAGKTTLLVHALASGMAGLVSNDRVLVEIGEGGATARGIPTAVRIRPGTLTGHPELRAGDRPGERPLLYHRGERVDVLPAVSDTLTLSPSQLARRLGVPSVARAPLGAVVGVEVDPRCASWSLEVLDTAAGDALLRAGLYGGDGDARGDTIFEQQLGRIRPATMATATGNVTTALPVLRCRLGEDAYRVRVGGQTLLETLVDRIDRGRG
jgi:hypothetical protein